MPIARRPTPPPEAVKQTLTVMDSLNAWTADDVDEDEEGPKKPRVPLGYTPLAQSDKSAAVTGWRQIFDSESDNFNFAIGLVIILNAIVIGLETDYGRSSFTIFEHVFNSIFVCEMLTRIMQIGVDYFTTPAYLFDCSLVLSGTLDLWILPAISGSSNKNSVGYQFSVMRLLRILRLLRVLRVIRLFRMFGQLLLMIKAFGKAFQVVLLLSILVFIMIYAMGIVATQLIGHKADEWGDNADDIEFWFGTIMKSMATLFWVMFGSAWDPLLHLLSQVYPTGMVLALFAAFMVINVALLSLIVGLISESLIIAQQEFKARTLEKFAGKKKAVAAEYTEELNALLEDEMDEVGAVEGRDLKQAVKGDSTLITKLIGVGVSLSLDGLMQLVESMSKGGTQRVVIDHFIDKLINLSGNSSASSVVDVKYDLLKNRQRTDSVSSQVDGMKDAIAANGEKIDMIMRKLDDLLARPPAK
jgi:hypothetical protein